MKSMKAATRTMIEPIQKGKALFILYSLAPPKKDRIAPTPPIRLMIPLACERYRDGVRSGIKAMTGVRQKAMLRSKVLVQATNNGRIAAIGMKPKATALMGAPIKINGKRLPMGVRRRSDHAPRGGWMNRAAILSRVIKNPINPGARWNLSLIHISEPTRLGMISYAV